MLEQRAPFGGVWDKSFMLEGNKQALPCKYPALTLEKQLPRCMQGFIADSDWSACPLHVCQRASLLQSFIMFAFVFLDDKPKAFLAVLSLLVCEYAMTYWTLLFSAVPTITKLCVHAGYLVASLSLCHCTKNDVRSPAQVEVSSGT
jgi:hypothetical protein